MRDIVHLQCTECKRKNYSTIAVHRVQTQELQHDQEQEDHHGQAGVQEVLPSRRQTHAAPRSEVSRLFGAALTGGAKQSDLLTKGE